LKPSTRITFLGDTLVGGEAQAVLDEKGPSWAFAGIRDLLGASDLVIANHEGPITVRAEPEAKLDTGRKRYWYRAKPEAARALADAGVRVVSLGNNHVLDFGASGLADTIAALDDAGIAHCGAGGTRTEARRPAVVEVNGLRLGFLSFMQRYDLYVAERLYATRDQPGPLRLRVDRVRSDLTRLATRVDITVALAHWGRNYRRVTSRQRQLATELCAAGADLVIGHHPHVPQRVTIQRGVPVCYSLGNGPLGTPGRFHSGRPPYGLVVSFDLDGRATPRRISVALIHVDNAKIRFQPRVVDAGEAEPVLCKLLSPRLDWEPSPEAGMTAELQRDQSPFDQNSSTAEVYSSSQRSRALNAEAAYSSMSAAASVPSTIDPSE
jgi:poly-gamma-glutamate synthesis protein (capsule biosynthesis protein)